MRFLFCSERGRSLPLAQQCAAEGNEVRMYVHNPVSRGLINGFIPLCSAIQPGDGEVVVADYPGLGRKYDSLRHRGTLVLCGSTFADDVGLTPGYTDALLFASQADTVPVDYWIGGWFNGQDWVAGLNSVYVQETRLMCGDVGPKVDCAGTTFCYWKKLRPPVFKRTLGRLTRALRTAQYHGPISIRNREVRAGLDFDCAVVATRLAGIAVGKLLADCASGKLKRVTPCYDFGVAIRVSVHPWPISDGSYRKYQVQCPSDAYRPYNTQLGVVTGYGRTITEARNVVLTTVRTVTPVDVQYRTDIGIAAKRVIPNLLKESK